MDLQGYRRHKLCLQGAYNLVIEKRHIYKNSNARQNEIKSSKRDDMEAHSQLGRKLYGENGISSESEDFKGQKRKNIPSKEGNRG